MPSPWACFAVTVLSALALSTPQASSNTQALTFAEVAEAPAGRTLLTETANEKWYFVPASKEQRRSSFAVFDKESRQWRTRVAVLQPGMHFGKQGHDHYGHPLVILDERE